MWRRVLGRTRRDSSTNREHTTHQRTTKTKRRFLPSHHRTSNTRHNFPTIYKSTTQLPRNTRDKGAVAAPSGKKRPLEDMTSVTQAKRRKLMQTGKRKRESSSTPQLQPATKKPRLGAHRGAVKKHRSPRLSPHINPWTTSNSFMRVQSALAAATETRGTRRIDDAAAVSTQQIVDLPP